MKKKKNEKNEDEEASLDKLVKLTKMMKQENIKVAPKAPSRANNKWRSQEPKFAEKQAKPADVVQAGGMDVDPARKEEYENWRKDKMEEENYRREAAQRKLDAARKRAAETPASDPPSETPSAE